jgi:DNA-directed RNA polymerase subunit RPC12/RpoP
MAYLGNLTCRDCGLTFTSRWGSFQDADEYRCESDHVLHVEPTTGAILAVDGDIFDGRTLVDVRGLCPRCSTELTTGRLPSCPVCGGRDHDVLLSGTLG